MTVQFLSHLWAQLSAGSAPLFCRLSSDSILGAMTRGFCSVVATSWGMARGLYSLTEEARSWMCTDFRSLAIEGVFFSELRLWDVNELASTTDPGSSCGFCCSWDSLLISATIGPSVWNE